MDDIFSQFEESQPKAKEKVIDLSQRIERLKEAAPDIQPPAVIPKDTTSVPFSIQKLARDHTEEAFEVITEIMRNKEVEASTRLEAAKQVLDRGWGKPTVQVKQETVKYTLQDLQVQLLENKTEIDERMEEARRIESEHFARYITADVEVIEDSASHSKPALQDN